MRLYFVRHGQSMGNLTGDYSTSLHGKLSVNGAAQAEALIEKLKDYKFDHIFVSPIERTVMTILPYLRKNNIAAELWGELVEACWQKDRDAEAPLHIRYGVPIHLDEKYMKYFCFRCDDQYRALPPEDENYQEGLRRVAWTYKYLLENYKDTDKSILVVGHGFAGSRLLEMFLGLEPAGNIDHSNTGFSMIERLPSGAFQIKFINR